MKSVECQTEFTQLSDNGDSLTKTADDDHDENFRVETKSQSTDYIAQRVKDGIPGQLNKPCERRRRKINWIPY